jgi:hypothetical protein
VNAAAARPFEENIRVPLLVFHEENRMTTTDRDRPAANRSASEIAFVLRRAKWRRGPEVLRDVARAQDPYGRAPARKRYPRDAIVSDVAGARSVN